MRKISQEGIEHLKRWEGKKLNAYLDSAKVPTIGYGHTSRAGPPTVVMGMTITDAEAEAILKRDLGQYERAVESLVKVPLTDNQFAALVSFTYNVGVGAFKKSTLLRKLNGGDYDGVPNELGKWVNAGGKRVAGLANRRAAEAGLWAKGAFVASQDAPARPAKQSAALAPEALSAYAATGATAVSAFGGLSGPIAWAVAAVIVIAACVAVYFFVQRVRERNP